MSTESRVVAPPKPKEFLSLKRLSVKDLVSNSECKVLFTFFDRN